MSHVTGFLLVEDDDDVAEQVARTLRPHAEVLAVRTARGAQNALFAREHWTAFVIDEALPDGSGFDVLRIARTAHARTPALMLSGVLDEESLNLAFDLAAAYVLKPVCPQRLQQFIARALPSFGRRVSEAVGAWTRRYALSDAEAEILSLAAEGMDRIEIAERRSSSPLTIKKHASNLLQKTTDETLHSAVARLLREVASH